MKITLKIKLILLITFSSLNAVDFGSINLPSIDEIGSNLKSVGNGAVNLLGGFAGGFGYCATNREYSMQVFNDTPSPVYATIQNIVGFLGAKLQGTPIATVLINPLTNSADTLKKLGGVCAGKVYLSPPDKKTFNTIKDFTDLTYAGKSTGLNLNNTGGTVIYVAANIFDTLSTLVGSLGGTEALDAVLDDLSFYKRPFDSVADDPSTYFYRAYYTKGKNHGEFLNADLGTSTDFSGIFYNGSSKNAQLTYLKDEKTYTVTLEKNTFNILSSTPGVTNSIRPDSSDDTKAFADRRSFTFTLDNNETISIPISSTGLADNVLDNKGKVTKTIARIYTYEIFDDSDGQNVGMQGLQIGNYDQPGVISDESKTAVIANLPTDITERAPVIAGLADNTSFYAYPLLKNLRDINSVTSSIWYQSADTALQKSIADPSFNYSSIPYNLPQTLWIYYKEKDSSPTLQQLAPDNILNFEFFRPTVSENLATLFVFALDTTSQEKAQQFFDNLFVTTRPQQYYTQITDPLSIPEISSITPDTNGVVNDPASGVTGWFLLKDVFTRTGIGSGPFYYSIPPSYLILNQLTSIIKNYIDATAYADTTSLNKALMQPVISWLSYYELNKDKIEAMDIKDVTSTNLTKAIPELTNYLQTNGTNTTKANINAALYTIIYGPTSITKPPLYMQGGNNYFTSKPAGWPSQN